MDFQIWPDDIYRATVHLRRGGAWMPKLDAEAIDHVTAVFRSGWLIGPEDSSLYAGEWAMIPMEVDWPVGWIASGDLFDWQDLSQSGAAECSRIP